MSLERMLADLVQRTDRRFYGKYRALVVDNADPEHLGRLRLRVPSVTGPDVVTGWATACVPYGGAAGQGLLFLPDVGAGVWVEYEEGDLEFPVWVGTFWSKPGGDSEIPPPNDAAGAKAQVKNPPTSKILKTAKGHSLQFEDNDGEERITLVEAFNGNVITLDRNGITINDGANGHRLVLDSAGITITDGVTKGNTITMAAGGLTVATSGTQLEIGTSGVKIGGGASEPLILGNQFMAQVSSFLTALSTHTHVGNLGAPTSPPVTPITLNVPLSSKHMVE